MSLSTQLLQTLNRIVEGLSSEECERLSYLCGGLHVERCTNNIREMLQLYMVQTNKDQTFLMELMLRMRRYDLLSGVLGISKVEAEQFLKNGRVLSDYRVLMAELSDDVGSEDLELLTFLLRGTLPKEKVEKLKSFLDVVTELEKLDQISSTRIDVMEKYLRAIRRADLAKRLNQYQSRANIQSPATLKLKDELRPKKAATGCSLTYTTSVPFPPSVHQSQTSTVFPSTSWSLKERLTPCFDTKEPPRFSPSKQCEWQEEVYWMRSKPRGMCVIIDCVGNEGDHLEQLFSRLHFRVSHHKLLGAREVQSCLEKISKQTEHDSMDAVICCIISRSNAFQLLGTDSYHLGLDLNAVRQLFTPNSCPGLTGKPKLFFIQSYETSQSVQDGELETDSPACSRCESEKVPEDADVFWSHCWTNEKQLEDINHHSVYLESLQTALIDGQLRRLQLVDIHMAVNRAVYTHNHSHPEASYHLNLRHTLRKNLYFS